MTQKSLGQIAWEIETEGYGLEWSEISEKGKPHWERIAQAVAEAERERICAWLRSDNNGSIAGSACLYVAALAIESEYEKGEK